MTFLKYSILVFFLIVSGAALSASSSEETIAELLAITKARSVIDGLQAQIKEIMHKGVQQALRGRSPSPEQQDAITKLENKVLTLLNKELAWENIEPRYIQLYQASFTEEELNGMLSFYRTLAGQAVINKMPILVQQAMLQTLERQQRFAPEMQRIQAEFMSDIEAASKLTGNK